MAASSSSKSKSNWYQQQNQREIVSFTPEKISICTKYFNTKIGSGGFATVFQGTLPLEGEYDERTVAIKCYSFKSNMRKQYEVKKNCLSTFTYRNIVELFGYSDSEDQSNQYLELEYLSSCLADIYLGLEWTNIVKVLKQVASALQYLHQCEGGSLIWHDLKTGNILFDDQNTAKICDFGSVRRIGETPEITTAAYVAPEVLRLDKKVTQAADVYSYGVVMLQLMLKEEEENIGTTADRLKLAKAKGRESKHVKATIVEKALKEQHKRGNAVHKTFLEGDCTKIEAMNITTLALECTELDADKRPSIAAVAARLEILNEAQSKERK